MPTYEYKCDACEHQFEQFQSIKADALTKCPQCGKNKLRRLISSGAALLFKGSGFYITDYRSENYKSKASSENGGKPADAKAGDAKPADAKPAAESKPAANAAGGSSPAPAGPTKPAAGPKGSGS